MAIRLEIDGVNLTGDFEFLSTLGVGSFGRVKFAKYKKDGKMYAVKFMKKAQIIDLKQVDHINGEKELQQNIHHPFCVNMMGYAKCERFVYIVMECVGGGELFQHLRRVGKFNEEQSRWFGAIVACAWAHIHGKDIIHRDLKPENVLICQNGYGKVTDFGFAKVIASGDHTYTLCGTPEYIAPEVLLNKGHGKPVDWWTLGILIYEMLCGAPPFVDDDPLGIYQKIIAGKAYFPKTMNPDAKQVIKKLCTADLGKRWGDRKEGPQEVLNAKWISHLDLKKLEAVSLPSPYDSGMKDEHDLSNIEEPPESAEWPRIIPEDECPFIGW